MLVAHSRVCREKGSSSRDGATLGTHSHTNIALLNLIPKAHSYDHVEYDVLPPLRLYGPRGARGRGRAPHADADPPRGRAATTAAAPTAQTDLGGAHFPSIRLRPPTLTNLHNIRTMFGILA